MESFNLFRLRHVVFRKLLIQVIDKLGSAREIRCHRGLHLGSLFALRPVSVFALLIQITGNVCEMVVMVAQTLRICTAGLAELVHNLAVEISEMVIVLLDSDRQAINPRILLRIPESLVKVGYLLFKMLVHASHPFVLRIVLAHQLAVHEGQRFGKSLIMILQGIFQTTNLYVLPSLH